MKKTIFIGLAIFLAIVGVIGIVYMVRKPATPKTPPTPKPSSIAEPSPTTAPVFVVEQQNSCSKSFVVACGSPSPSPSLSPSPSPSGSVSPSPSPSLSPSPSPSNPPEANLDCVVKRMYLDDSRNSAGVYYREIEITDTNTVQDGQLILYNVVAKNNGAYSVPDTTITDTLSNNLTYVDGDTGCSYDAGLRQVTCNIGALAGGSEVQKSFRARVAASGTTSVANTAEVSSTNGQRDSCSVRIDATGRVSLPPSSPPNELPVAGVFEVTTGTLGIGLLLLILGGLGLLLI